MADKQTCADRIDHNLLGRLDDINQIIEASESGNSDASEQGISEWTEYPLDLTITPVLRVDLSTGGPADWFECYIDDESKQIYRIEYHYADWFDHASVTLEGNQFTAAKRFCDFFVEVMLYGR